METRREERIQKLYQALKETDKIHLRDAARLLDISEMTIRRDLSAEPSALILLGGYIVIDPKINNANHYIVTEQKSKNVDEKRYIGQQAAALIEENDTIFFDAGTTVPFIIDNIADELHFTGICYSLNTFLALQEKPNCTIVLCGGIFKTGAYLFTPVSNHSELDYICPNVAFISAAGISLTHGVTSFMLDEVRIKIQAMTAAKKKILVADRHKFDSVKPGRFAQLEQFDSVITDSLPNEVYQRFLRNKNIEVII